MLQFLYSSKQSDDTSSTGYKGWYYHFLRMDDGLREWKCELSTIDTGWLIAGVIFARQYFNGGDESEKIIRGLAEKIIKRIDWNFFQMAADSKFPYAVNFAWQPEEGFHPWGWFGYTEAQFFIYLPLDAECRIQIKLIILGFKLMNGKKPYQDLAHVIFPPLFGHQYTQMFVDLRGLTDFPI